MVEHLCLVKPHAIFDDQEMAISLAKEHLASAIQAQIEGGGSLQDFALSLRHAGYKSVSDFRMVNSEA